MPPEEQNENPTEETPKTPAGEQPKDDSEQEQPAGEQPEGEPSEESPEGEDLPDWARTKLTKANAEAANYRTKLREAEKKLESVKTPEEVEALLAEMKAERESEDAKSAQEKRDLLIENIALKYKLPAKLQNRLVGNTREELEADAKELASDFAEGDDEEIFLEGGLSPKNRDTDPDDPRALAQKYGGRKRR